MKNHSLTCLFLVLLSSCSKPYIESSIQSSVTPEQPGCKYNQAEEVAYNSIVSHRVASNPVSQTFEFQITYRENPQFMIADCNQRQAHAFQLYIAYDTTRAPSSEASWDVIVRGGEIYDDGTIKLRSSKSSGPISATPNGMESGGWGPLMTPNGMSYQLLGRTVEFSIPWAVMGDPDGKIYYDLLNTNYGGMNLLIRNTLVTH